MQTYQEHERIAPAAIEITLADDYAIFPNRWVKTAHGEHLGVIQINLHDGRVTTWHLGDQNPANLPRHSFYLFFNESAQGRCINEWLRRHQTNIEELTELFYLGIHNGTPAIRMECGYIESFSSMNAFQNTIVAMQNDLDSHVLNSPHRWVGEFSAAEILTPDVIDLSGKPAVIFGGQKYNTLLVSDYEKLVTHVGQYLADNGFIVRKLKAELNQLVRV